MMIGLSVVSWVAAALVCVGLFGALARRDQVGALVSLGVMASAVVLDLAARARFVAHARTSAQVLAVLVLVLAAAQIAVGLSMVMRARSRRARSDGGERA